MRILNFIRSYGGYLLVVIALSVGVFLFRYHTFKSVEPRYDQGDFACWVQDIQRSDHLLPVGKDVRDIVSKFESDRSGGLYNLVIRIYYDPVRLLTIVSLFTTYLMTLLLGDSYSSQVVISILGATGSVLLIALYLLWIETRASDGSNKGASILSGATAILVVGSSFYLHLYSPFGVHNWGIFYLVLAVAITSAMLEKPALFPKKALISGLIIVGIVQILALFAHWTNLVFLPLATVLLILIRLEGTVKKKILTALIYSAFVVIFLGPVILLMFTKAPDSPEAYTGMKSESTATLLQEMVRRGAEWFEIGAKVYSVPGLVAALWGLVYLGTRAGIFLPLLIVVSHFIAWCAVPGFSRNWTPTWTRTYTYILPLFGLGMTFLIIAGITLIKHTLEWTPAFLRSLRVQTALPVLSVILLSGHLWVQIPCLISHYNVQRRIPEFWDEYLYKQNILRNVVDEMQGFVEGRAILLSWDQRGYPYKCLEDPNRNGFSNIPPLNGLWASYLHGRLAHSLKRREIRLPEDRKIFVFASAAVENSELRPAIAAIFGPAGLNREGVANLSPVKEWKTGIAYFGDTVLYEVRFLPADNNSSSMPTLRGAK